MTLPCKNAYWTSPGGARSADASTRVALIDGAAGPAWLVNERLKVALGVHHHEQRDRPHRHDRPPPLLRSAYLRVPSYRL